MFLTFTLLAAPKPAFSEVAKRSKGSEEAYTEIRLETKTKDSAEPKVEIGKFIV